VEPIVEKTVESWLMWFGHVWRRPVDSIVRRVDQMEGSLFGRGRGKPRKIMFKTIMKEPIFGSMFGPPRFIFG
jgi:hypothetical protein